MLSIASAFTVASHSSHKLFLCLISVLQHPDGDAKSHIPTGFSLANVALSIV